MTHIPNLTQSRTVLAGRFTATARRLLDRVDTLGQRARTRQALADLDDRLLADIGRSETDRRTECAKRCWQA